MIIGIIVGSYIIGAILVGITISLNYNFEFIPLLEEVDANDEAGIAIVLLWPLALPVIILIIIFKHGVYDVLYKLLDKRYNEK